MTYYENTIVIEPNEINVCGLNMKQIDELLSHSAVKGITTNSKCSETQNFNSYQQCLNEQNKFIECLQKEYFITKGKNEN